MNLESLKVHKFWSIVESGGVEQIACNYRPGKRYNATRMHLIEQHWKKLYDEFYSLRDNKTGQFMLNKNHELSRLSLTLTLLGDIETRLIMLINLSTKVEAAKFVGTRTAEAILDFKKIYPRVKISLMDDCFEALQIVQASIKALINTVDEKAGVKETNIEKQRETIYDVTSMMSKYLGYNIDVNNLNCLEFIGHENTINKISKAENSKAK
jgi:hypothetical protein